MTSVSLNRSPRSRSGGSGKGDFMEPPVKRPAQGASEARSADGRKQRHFTASRDGGTIPRAGDARGAGRCCKMPRERRRRALRYRSGDILKVLAFLLLRRGRGVPLPLHLRGRDVPHPGGEKDPRGAPGSPRAGGGAAGPRALHPHVRHWEACVAPVTPFTIAGAVIFGKFHGMLYNLAGEMLGASIAFFLGRYFLHGMARNFLETKLPWLDRKAARRGVFGDLLPADLLVPLHRPELRRREPPGSASRDYFLGTLLGILPAVVIVTYFIGALRDLLAEVPAAVGPRSRLDTLAPIALLILSFFIPSIVKRLRKPPAGDASPRVPHPPERMGSHVRSSGVKRIDEVRVPGKDPRGEAVPAAAHAGHLHPVHLLVPLPLFVDRRQDRPLADVAPRRVGAVPDLDGHIVRGQVSQPDPDGHPDRFPHLHVPVLPELVDADRHAGPCRRHPRPPRGQRPWRERNWSAERRTPARWAGR